MIITIWFRRSDSFRLKVIPYGLERWRSETQSEPSLIDAVKELLYVGFLDNRQSNYR